MARRRGTTSKAAPSNQQTWRVHRPRLTATQEHWQWKYKPPPCACHGRDADWRLEADMGDESILWYYCLYCGKLISVTREEQGHA